MVLVLLFSGCQNSNSLEVKVNEKAVLENLKIISHDSMNGRFYGTECNIKGQNFIAQKFKEISLEPFIEDNYLQKFSYTFEGEFRQNIYPISDSLKDSNQIPDTTVYGGNVIGKIKGKSEKIIIISAHHDHLGKNENAVYNGADDNASGVAALISMAAYFKNRQLKHTMVFAALDGEEITSLGGQYLLKNFPAPLNDIVVNINMDMISHNDKNELYACGTFHYPQLKPALKSIKNSNINLLFGHDDPEDPNLDNWTYASDHRLFHERDIPFIYFGVEDHEDYHKPSDTFGNINQDFYVEAVKLITVAVEEFDNSL